MTLKRLIPALLAVTLAAFAGCGDTDAPTRPGVTTTDPAPWKAEAGNVINHYEIRFDGRTVTGGETRFAWTVTGTGVDPALSHFRVQLPECAPEPVAYSPTGSVSLNGDPNTGIYGLEWHLNVEADDTVGRQYSITFPGDVPLGEVYAAVSSGDVTGVGVIPGPCQGYDIAGRVFVDANENGLRDPEEESGIANVQIELIDAEGRVSTAATDAFGDYRFRKLGGAYTIRLGLAGVDGYFNGGLTNSFDPTTALSFETAVPPESTGNDFGFSPQSEEIIFDLESGALLSDGASLKFWKSVFRTANSNGNRNPVYDNATLLGFLHEVEGLFLADPYRFTPGSELQEAFAILRSSSKDPVDQLLSELLATELNQAAGRGLIGNEDLQLVLISWGEALIADARAADAAAAAPEKGRTPGDDLSTAIQLFGMINTGGGGGVDE